MIFSRSHRLEFPPVGGQWGSSLSRRVKRLENVRLCLSHVCRDWEEKEEEESGHFNSPRMAEKSLCVCALCETSINVAYRG